MTKKLIIILIVFSGCYNMRMHDYYGHLNNVYSDSMDCARKCHKDSLALEYGWKMNMALDSANYYYYLDHPRAKEKEAKNWQQINKYFFDKQAKCNCK